MRQIAHENLRWGEVWGKKVEDSVCDCVVYSVTLYLVSVAIFWIKIIMVDRWLMTMPRWIDYTEHARVMIRVRMITESPLLVCFLTNGKRHLRQCGLFTSYSYRYQHHYYHRHVIRCRWSGAAFSVLVPHLFGIRVRINNARLCVLTAFVLEGHKSKIVWIPRLLQVDLLNVAKPGGARRWYGLRQT